MVLFILSLVSNYGSSYILSHLNLNQLPANDFLLLITPRIPWMGYVADGVLLLIGTIIIFSERRNLPRLAFIINTVSITLLMRSILVLLTPVNNSFGQFEYWDLLSFSRYPSGMFPSGHTACAFISYLFVRSKSLFILMLIEIFALITSHGHYSIDIVGGLMLSYIIYRLGQDFQQTKLS